MKTLLLFDVDNTIVDSGKNITLEMECILSSLTKKYDLGIVGGGTYEKIEKQLNPCMKIFKHVFVELGCIYYLNGKEKETKKDLRNHALKNSVDKIIKHSLQFLSQVPYELDGHLIDFRKGLVYISLIGMSADESKRQDFINNYSFYRDYLLQSLIDLQIKDISIKKGGKVGIAIFPNEYDKIQVLSYLETYDKIYYFGDSYGSDGNDYQLLNHKDVTGVKVNNKTDTFAFLQKLL